MKRCWVAAITGRSGSGKSTVSAYYAAEGYPVLDADKIAREITEPGAPCLARLQEAFGAEIVRADGTLDRAMLAARAFATPESSARLTQITHPEIICTLLSRIDAAHRQGAKLVFVDGAVIVGAEFERYCDILVVVTSPEREAITRIMLRDGISKEAARRRLEAQLPEQALRAAAHYVIENSTSQKELLRQAGEVLREIRDRMEQYEDKKDFISDPGPACNSHLPDGTG